MAGEQKVILTEWTSAVRYCRDKFMIRQVVESDGSEGALGVEPL